MKKIIILISCSSFFISCEQISKSINDTLNPNDTLANSQTKEPKNETPENTQPDIQTIINTVIENHTTTHTQQHIESNSINFLTDISALQKAEDALKKLPQYAGKEIFVYSTLYFYDDGRINVMLQHPKIPKYADQYDYKDGKWSEPKPVQLSVRDDIQNRLVALNKTRFVNAARVTKIYNEKAKEIEGAKPTTSVYILIWDNQIRWYPTNINGSRERYSIQFNDDGTLKTFKQD
ncbi:hypothetical protein OIU83_03515 [Flavobacterium sp. LS1R49]|uniref:Uncharacterized protein n=1 Tax=Flavobacterium shii TaxID=2987687 RepID=A0A9X3C445_9FLAO|nr:hypothetical protein [Flavobacterium shii]MCV9926699.1 hypothetical protein [Flavobacterium shii]